MSAPRSTGLVVIDKPSGLTSHDVVERVRKVIGERVGHAGTLDPQATGVLLLCVGSATRMARFLQGHDKIYEGVVRLGWSTDTYDAEGEAVEEADAIPSLEREGVEEILQSFVGTQRQVPPVYSAKKIRGQPAYRRARRGEKVEPKPVTVHIHAADLVELSDDELRLRIHCGSGTYVRTLAHDLGAALGCPAHLAGLRRTQSGPFSLEEAVTWPEFEEIGADELRQRVLPTIDMVPHWPVAVLSAEGAEAVANGGVVEAGWIVERRPGVAPAVVAEPTDEGWVRVVDDSGRMIAAGEMIPGGLVQPRIVLR